MDDNKEKLTAKFAKMDQNFFNPVCLWHIQQTTIAYFVYWPAQSLTKINFCCSTRVFYSTIKAANICSGILLLSFLAFQLFGPPKCLWSSYHGSRGSRFLLTTTPIAPWTQNLQSCNWQAWGRQFSVSRVPPPLFGWILSLKNSERLGMEASNPWLPLALHLHCVAQQHKEWHANVMEIRFLCMSSSNCLFPPAKKEAN